MAVAELLKGQTAVGTMIRLVRDPAIALVAANAGLDFLMLDMEHGPFSFETLADFAAMARAGKIDCFVRVPELSKGNVSRALDCGAVGVMVPMIRDAEDARLFVGWAKYAPVGMRGICGQGCHTGFRDQGDCMPIFTADENAKILTIAQIELACAVDNVEAIASVAGIDALLIGPADLSNSLGVPGDLNHPRMDEAIAKVAAAAQKHGKIFGLHAGDPLTRKWMESGLTLRMSLTDMTMLQKSMEVITKLRD